MNQIISRSALISGIGALFAVGMITIVSAAEKQTKTKSSPKDEFPFDQVGTVTKHGVDTCMVGINYELHSAVKPPLHKTTHWLAAVSKSDRAILDQASQDGGVVRVKGTAMISVEHCQWVAVSSVTRVKNSSENKTMKKELVYKVDSVRITVIKKNPPEYQIEAEGKTRTGGWSNPELIAVVYVHPPEDGIYGYEFYAEPPSGAATQTITRISATKVLDKMPKGFRGVRVKASTNKKEAILGE